MEDIISFTLSHTHTHIKNRTSTRHLHPLSRLRMLIGVAVREGAVRGLRVTPVFSLYSFHGPVFRTMLRVTRSSQWPHKEYGFIGEAAGHFPHDICCICWASSSFLSSLGGGGTWCLGPGYPPFSSLMRCFFSSVLVLGGAKEMVQTGNAKYCLDPVPSAYVLYARLITGYCHVHGQTSKVPWKELSGAVCT
eukprot:scaffold29961_cov16-Tisochrysis_lutea.AAC.5